MLYLVCTNTIRMSSKTSKLAAGLSSFLKKEDPEKSKKVGIASVLDDEPKKESEESVNTMVMTLDDEANSYTATGDDKVKALQPNQILTKATVRDISENIGRHTIWLRVDMIKERPFFNVRTEMGDIPGLAMSILNNKMREPIHVDLVRENNMEIAYITDGYRRKAAVDWLNNNGYPYPNIECFVNSNKTTEIDRIVLMFVSQDNKKLEPPEIAACFIRLMNLGFKTKGIAEKFGKSESYVRDMISFGKQAPDIQELVTNGSMTISALTKLNQQEKDPVKFRKTITETLKKNKKIRPQDISKLKPNTPGFIFKRTKELSTNKATIFGNHVEEFSGTADVVLNFLTGESSAEDCMQQIAALQEQPNTPYSAFKRIKDFETTMLPYFSEDFQKNMAIFIGYLLGNVPVEELVDMKDLSREESLKK
jgi:hypothetical protein